MGFCLIGDRILRFGSFNFVGWQGTDTEIVE